MGKTALATNMAYNVAEYMSHDKNMDPKSKGVAFFSLEMSADQLASRILATVTQTNGHKMRTGELDNAESPPLPPLFANWKKFRFTLTIPRA